MLDQNAKAVDVAVQVLEVIILITDLKEQYTRLFMHILEIAQARPVLQTSLMQRMTDVLSRMLNDPATRAALCGGGEDNLEGVIDHQDNTQNSNESVTESGEERRDNETERVETVQTQINQESGI